MDPEHVIGITTTVPSEVIFAAGLQPVDLNNLFIGDRESEKLVFQAERAGFPNNTCAWIKGLYSTVLTHGITRVIAVNQGDCSNTQALMETLRLEGVEVIPFGFPYGRNREMLEEQIRQLEGVLGTSHDKAEEEKATLDSVRGKALRLDEETWRDGRISGFENHLLLVSCSDFEGNPRAFETKLDDVLSGLQRRDRREGDVRIGYVGVPPIFTQIYSFIERMGGRVVFNEIQRQFAMPEGGRDLVEQYLRYTYPYDIFARIEDITREIKKRNIDGIVHYVQSFCFRQISDVILRRTLPVPVLTIEGDLPGRFETLNLQKIEIFLDMLRRRKKGKHDSSHRLSSSPGHSIYNSTKKH
jgi:benzoyl-CoA reductase/2-hydroxyglutaryl-CoA dehydratase subunit BcrC/BadD/HgdB